MKKLIVGIALVCASIVSADGVITTTAPSRLSLQREVESLRKEVEQLKEQLAVNMRQVEDVLAELKAREERRLEIQNRRAREQKCKEELNKSKQTLNQVIRKGKAVQK